MVKMMIQLLEDRDLDCMQSIFLHDYNQVIQVLQKKGQEPIFSINFMFARDKNSSAKTVHQDRNSATS